jgi:predicted site-specific integrase-resolvase
MHALSTLEVARVIGVHKQTLLDWLYAGKVREPKRQTVGGQVVRIWSQSDIERVREYKRQNYCKGRGRKKKV